MVGKYSLLTCLYLVILPWKVNSLIEIFDPKGMKVDTFHDVEMISVHGVHMEGYIVLADPPDACTALKKPTFQTNFTMSKFVLIKSSFCGFSLSLFRKEINNAADAGFDFAVIISDWEPPDLHYPLASKRHERDVGDEFGYKIPGTVIRTVDESRMEKYLYNTSYSFNYKVKVNLSDKTVVTYIVLVIVGLIFLAMLGGGIFLIIVCIQERRRSEYNAFQNETNVSTEGEEGSANASGDTELSFPAENRLLIEQDSSSNHSPTWGTFGDPLHLQENSDTVKPVPASSC